MIETTMMAHRFCLLIVLLIFMLSGCSTPPETTIETNGPLTEAPAPAPFTDSDIIPIGTSPTLGPDTALVTVVVFTDLQCPFCKRGADTMTQLLEKYPADVRVVLKHMPLPMHAQAREAAYAVVAAAEQGKAWEMHDLLFENQREMRSHAGDMRRWTTQLAESIGLDRVKFQASLDDVNTALAVEGDVLTAKDLGVRGTPHFFVNGERISGAQPIVKFEQVIDEQLAIARALIEEGTNRQDIYREAVALNHMPPEPKPTARAPKAASVAYVPVDANDPVLGNAKDPLVTIVAFSDFQCPFCKKVTPTIAQLEDAYGDKIRVVFKQLPLAFHREAKPAARAALAAHAQGKFWEMHDLLFERQAEFRDHSDDFEAFATGLANELNLDVAKFKKAYHSESVEAQIERDIALAAKVGSRGTPYFWINGVNLRGAQPFAAFKIAVDAQIEQAQKIKAEQKLSGDALYEAAVKYNKENIAAPEPAKAPAADVIDLKDLALGDAPVMGPEDAPVTVVMFSDFECPYCKRGHAHLTQAMAKYDGQVKVAFKHYPLPFHRNAKAAAKAALAAGEQGKFWEMHDLIFSDQQSLRQSEIYREYAEQLGLDLEKFEADLSSPAYDTIIEKDMAQGANIGVRGTPAFFINGRRFLGAQPVENFEAAIEKALEEAK
ncbi:thioredoxin domain-containing protein [Bradymonas sediminis]|nr:thioredoxin domain-containing protein [Bradymonas sediminis]TDP63665.1 protein-disulfide isomerase [Bradymonas sediminis]